MAAFTDFNDFLLSVVYPNEIGMVAKGTSGSAVAGRCHHPWNIGAPLGVAPTTAVVPTAATIGAVGQGNNAGGSNFIMGGQVSHRQPGVFVLTDRLSHQGGLSGTATGAQTTNLPTAALTRFTTGAGVMIGLDIYTDIGSTGTTVTASYTNQAGTASRTTTAVVWGGTGFRTSMRRVLLPLQSGDTGVRAVASVTAAGTTGTVGNFGVTLFKPLLFIPVDSVSQMKFDLFNQMLGGIPDIPSDACLEWMFWPTATTTVGPMASLEFAWH